MSEGLREGFVEYFNLYNEYGEKTACKISRTEAHVQGLCHRVFHLWMINSENQILVQQRSANKDFGANLWYVSVAGHICFDENIEQSILRET